MSSIRNREIPACIYKVSEIAIMVVKFRKNIVKLAYVFHKVARLCHYNFISLNINVAMVNKSIKRLFYRLKRTLLPQYNEATDICYLAI